MIDQRVEDRLRSLGLAGCWRGYRCLIYAALLVEAEPQRLELPTKNLYPDVARRCAMSPSAVDSAIRTAMRVCSDRCGEMVREMCGGVENPTVVQFLDGLVRSLPPEKSM